jgi:transposase
MDASTLLADPNAVELQSFVSHENSITIVVRSIQTKAYCPLCRQPSDSLHSNYLRRVADLPWHGVAVRLELHTRKFRCRNELCRRKVFCERFSEVVAVRARKTCRLNNALTLLAFALGGEAGARTARKLNLQISGDSLLRRIRQHLPNHTAGVRVLGVDDFAGRARRAVRHDSD